jgi:hypothetical protein
MIAGNGEIDLKDGLRRLLALVKLAGLALTIIWFLVVVLLSWEDFEYPKATVSNARGFGAMYFRLKEIVPEIQSKGSTSWRTSSILASLNDFKLDGSPCLPPREMVTATKWLSGILGQYDANPLLCQSKVEDLEKTLETLKKSNEEALKEASKGEHYGANPIASFIYALDFRHNSNITIYEIQSNDGLLVSAGANVFRINSNSDALVPAYFFEKVCSEVSSVAIRRLVYVVFWGLAFFLPVAAGFGLFRAFEWLLQGFVRSSD